MTDFLNVEQLEKEISFFKDNREFVHEQVKKNIDMFYNDMEEVTFVNGELYLIKIKPDKLAPSKSDELLNYISSNEINYSACEKYTMNGQKAIVIQESEVILIFDFRTKELKGAFKEFSA